MYFLLCICSGGENYSSPASHPQNSLIHLHTAPYEFIALSPGLQKIIQDYSKRGREGGACIVPLKI